MSPRRLRLPQDGSALVVVQDGKASTSGDLAVEVGKLAETLRSKSAARVILPTDRADHAIVGLLACQEIGCDLILHRGPILAEGLVAAMEADTVLGVDLQVATVQRSSQRPGGGARVVLMTSGTTGIPKAASHDLEHLAGLIPDDGPVSARWLLTYHPASFAGLQVILTALLGQAPLAALSTSDVGALSATAQTFAATSISGTPTFWRAFLIALAGREAVVPLRQATLGGETVDQAIIDRIRTHFPAARIVHIYASTEAGAVFAVRDGRAGFPASWLTEASGVNLRIDDDILQVRSPRLMSGYASRHASPVDGAGWLDTGDLVETDGDRVFFRGRRDSTINVGGQKVRPEEVEALILGLEGVVDAQVKAIANPITGQLVGVDLVIAPGVDEAQIKSAVRGLSRDLPAYAVPRIVRIVPELRMSQGGKKLRA